ncbi:3-mercaptopyruvate sulfurtransferase [Pseudohoeflea suaedae]|uniref:Sulfurtransferase n=1 Tax=Pseudohoeflea suaedae TaxID=877384 RepID=A0A4R5PL64_9HYPH|nr:3-mercaptopyruvate sulfurtransferase [Pseudohoeflea suaedae]TDH36068.1 3-mercaptopyruvate sulfurtransferase [Pseudohoeflea suaedae]
MTDTSPYLVSYHWLANRLGTPGLSIVDGSWYLPAMGRDHKAEFAESRIPGAVLFDQDDIVDPSSSLPHALPPADLFAEKVGALGIAETDTIVVYDGPGFFSAPRVWWLFRHFGAEKVYLLDGGFDGWKAGDLPLETSGPAPKTPRSFNAAPKDDVASLADMRSIVVEGNRQIADARPAGRFTGELPEPREGMRSGHMPGAKNVPVISLAENGKMKSLKALRDLFNSSSVDLSKPVVTTCGSGVTAAAISFALASLGHEDVRLYDGSWSEWGSRSDTPVEAGDA